MLAIDQGAADRVLYRDQVVLVHHAGQAGDADRARPVVAEVHPVQLR
jgi:hypothetical protein